MDGIRPSDEVEATTNRYMGEPLKKRYKKIKKHKMVKNGKGR